jgi:transposase-like protein
MTHQAHPSVTREVVQVLARHGFDGMAQVMELLFNECMKIERQQALGVGPYQRGEARRGQANGFKPKRLKTRIGPLELAVPQVRGAKFYPRALERGSRSEKALRLALAEMYVQGVSTAKVTRIIERGLHGVELITSDAHAGLKEARKACFPGVLWQRCRFHLMLNALAHVPREEMKLQVVDDLRSVLDSADEHTAGEQLGRVVRKYQKSAPKLAEWMEDNVPESLPRSACRRHIVSGCGPPTCWSGSTENSSAALAWLPFFRTRHRCYD